MAPTTTGGPALPAKAVFRLVAVCGRGRADRKAVCRQRRRGRRRQGDVLAGAVGQIEGELHGVAIRWVGAEIHRHRLRRRRRRRDGGVTGWVTVAPTVDAEIALSFNPNGTGCSGGAGVGSSSVSCTDAPIHRTGNPSVSIGAKVGGLTLGDHLLQPGDGRAVSVHDLVSRRHRRRVGDAAAEQIAIARLRIQHVDRVEEIQRRGFLAGGLAGIVERAAGADRGTLDLRSDVGQPLQRQIGDIDAGVHIGRGIGKAVVAVDLGADADRKAASGAVARIGVGNLAARELLGQRVELAAKIENSRADEGRSSAYAID